MKLYLTQNGRWAGTQQDARQLCLDDGLPPKAFEQVDVPTDKGGLIDYLNGYGTGVSTRIAPSPSQRDAASDLIGSRQPRVDLDDAFDALPLATKLHYAALALEEARDQIRPSKA